MKFNRYQYIGKEDFHYNFRRNSIIIKLSSVDIGNGLVDNVDKLLDDRWVYVIGSYYLNNYYRCVYDRVKDIYIVTGGDVGGELDYYKKEYKYILTVPQVINGIKVQFKPRYKLLNVIRE